MKVSLTVDLEQDCPPFFSSFRGMEEGLPRLLNLLEKSDLRATFFTTGDVARNFPESIKRIVSYGHEIGCHGDTHRRFDMMEPKEAWLEIKNASATLRKFYPVISFRAPNLVFPNRYLELLEKADYRLDSSLAKYKGTYRRGKRYPTRLQRLPASVTSSVLRLPKWIRFPWFRQLVSPVVLFVHPWEFVDLSQEKLRWDCRFRTGDRALNCLEENISFFKAKGASFHRLGDLI